VILLGADNIKE